MKYCGGSAFVRCCMSAAGVVSLHFIDGVMNHRVYIGILNKHIHASANKIGLNDNFIFTHVNDPKHAAYYTRQRVLYNSPKYLKTRP